MCDKDNRFAAACHIPQGTHEISLCPWIKAGSGLIQKQQTGVRDQLDRDAGSFSLTAAEGTDETVFLFAQLDHLDCTVNGIFVFLTACVPRQTQLCGIAKHVIHGQIVIDDILLRHVTDHRLELVEIAVQICSVDQYIAVCGREIPAHTAEKRRLSRT